MKKIFLLCILCIMILITGCNNNASTNKIQSFAIEPKTQISDIVDKIGNPSETDGTLYYWNDYELINGIDGTLKVDIFDESFNNGNINEDFIDTVHSISWIVSDCSKEDIQKIINVFQEEYPDNDHGEKADAYKEDHYLCYVGDNAIFIMPNEEQLTISYSPGVKWVVQLSLQ